MRVTLQTGLQIIDESSYQCYKLQVSFVFYLSSGSLGMKLRWGICSAGKICNDFVSALSSLPSEDHTVVAIASRSKEKAETFAEEHKIPVSYEGYEALAQDASVGRLLDQL